MNESENRLSSAIHCIDDSIDSAETGLPEEVFLLVSRITPLVNVDLLIQDSCKRTLLTWRDDRFYGPGWHVPGGIIRYKETGADRLLKVARQELSVEVDFDPKPLFVSQCIAPEKTDRAHAVSLLHRCRLKNSLDERQRFNSDLPLPGQWQWHEYCPDNLIPEQREYAVFFRKSGNSTKRIRSLTSHIPPSQLLRYIVVGFGNTVFAYGSFALFTAMLSEYMPASYLAGSLLSSLLNITVSFLNYKWFVFKTKGNYVREWFKCLIVYSGSIIFGLVVLPPLVFLMTSFTQEPKSAPYIAGALLTGVNVIISFVGHKNFSFRGSQTKEATFLSSEGH